MSGPRWNIRRSFLAAFSFIATLLGPAQMAHAEHGDELTVSVLTIGPGNHPFAKFGHDGILVEDARRGTSLFYNYGTFAFDSVWLIPKFLVGKYKYWLSVTPGERVIASYAAENRSLVVQRLRLTGEEKRSVATFLAWNAREDNKYYVYDYYRDNCATRVRDVIDGATRGALAKAARRPAQMTWRQHTQRLTADDILVYLGLDIAMGSFIDRPLEVWQEMFLPAKVEETLRGTIVPSPAPLSLVEGEAMLFSADRPEPLAEPPRWTVRFLAAGCAAALFLIGLGGAAGAGVSAARILLALTIAVVGLGLGLMGSLFVFLWIFTNHEVAHHNENILQTAPFAVLLAAQGLGVARGRLVALGRAEKIARAALACSAAGALLKVLPWFRQANGQWLALLLPVWAGTAAALWLSRRSLRHLERDGSDLTPHQEAGIE